MMIFVGQRLLHNVVTQDCQAAVLVLSLRQLIQLVHQRRGKDGLLGERVVLGKGIKEMQSVAVAKFVLVNLNLVAKVC